MLFWLPADGTAAVCSHLMVNVLSLSLRIWVTIGFWTGFFQECRSRCGELGVGDGNEKAGLSPGLSAHKNKNLKSLVEKRLPDRLQLFKAYAFPENPKVTSTGDTSSVFFRP